VLAIGVPCDAVSGRTDGQAILQATERVNLFLMPLDEVRVWWLYHHDSPTCAPDSSRNSRIEFPAAAHSPLGSS
jgi:hypothetical protein